MLCFRAFKSRGLTRADQSHLSIPVLPSQPTRTTTSFYFQIAEPSLPRQRHFNRRDSFPAAAAPTATAAQIDKAPHAQLSSRSSMASQAVKTKNTISLKGSAAIVADYFKFAVNNILYQRGVYPTEEFRPEPQYGVRLLLTKNEQLKKYLDTIIKQMSAWLEQGSLQRLVMVVSSIDTQEVLERWTFMVHTSKDAEKQQQQQGQPSGKELDTIQKEIGAVMRQINAAVSILPLLDTACTFELLAYTNKDMDVPKDWADSDARLIPNANELKFRSFSTKIHKVDTAVAYRQADTIDGDDDM